MRSFSESDKVRFPLECGFGDEAEGARKLGRES